MKLAVALDFVAPKLEGNMKVTKNEFSSYSVKCYGEDCDGNYIVLTADVEGNARESDFDVFHIKVLENDIEKTDYIVLAGYLSILSENFINKWNRKIINIHPSLLPKYGGKGMYGIKVHEAVIANKEKESGCTIHFVDNGIDTGEIITNVKVPVYENDTPEILQKRVLEKEHILLIEGIKKLLGQ